MNKPNYNLSGIAPSFVWSNLTSNQQYMIKLKHKIISEVDNRGNKTKEDIFIKLSEDRDISLSYDRIVKIYYSVIK